MQNDCRLAWLAVLLTLANCGVGHGHPPEPQATFALKNGWVEVTLRKDGRPVANATIEITNQNGRNDGGGETDDEGFAAFPLPPGHSFIVEIKAGDRTADPIRLFKSDAGGVEPACVLLSYGLRPCCRSIKPPSQTLTADEPAETPPAIEEPTSWHLVVPMCAGFSIAAVAMFMICRR
jgi:hypothetical protein